jgi:hypothetical protein
MWLIEQGAILTKDNMLKRNWHGDPNCYFCNSPESMNHLFFECPVSKVTWGVIATCFSQNNRPLSYDQFWAWISKALPGGESFYMFGLAAICWATWKSRNRACFEKKLIKNPCEIFFSACAFMHYWAGLYPEKAQKVISAGVDVMMQMALKLLGKQEAVQKRPALKGPKSEDEDEPETP